ncbi:MAG: PEP-CTERM sorting domain-containing protein [Planctomycetes bacterium]|nr:PEP-CTERM sorting domain-containing protein [Planctomycetota bacterium]
MDQRQPPNGGENRRAGATRRAAGFRLSVFVCVLCGILAVENRVDADFIETTLYDGTLQAVTPDNYSPKWLAFGGVGGSQSYDSGTQSTRLVTSDQDQAGYSNYSMFTGPVNSSFPKLDRTKGYSIGFTLQITSESHTRTERAGFSVIAISSDVASGVKSSIEIGFQDGRLFSQNDNPLFGNPVADENLGFDPVGTGFIDYVLSVRGSNYSLSVGDTVVLAGSLRDYTAADLPPLLDPYEKPNFIYFGDNTTSASADINLRKVTVSVATVPEPSSFAILAVGGVLLLVFQKRRRARLV